ncbi:MAG TPA: M20/M25/M40 family metallo-hydrolase [Lentisphaeria bacterium]|nr:M20/M25/M40 family metallo-hydrolase [Lentisphaeria bacterium]
MDELVKHITALVQDRAVRDYVTELLVSICRHDTSPSTDVDVMRQAEAAVFDILERQLAEAAFAGAHWERRPINPAIALHPAYSQLHFTKTAERPQGLPPETVYAGRSNLLYFVPDAAGRELGGIALNAHVDVIAPYIPPRVENGIVYGRGACDDKGAVVVIITALRLLSQVLKKAGRKLKRNVVAMFVVEEETGGNGSLSLAIDRDLKKLYDSILVLECTGNNIHPANRGAVWYQVDLSCPGVNLFEMAAFVYEQLEWEGRAIKAESRHALFPQRPVQTCHGIIGHYGEHPSRICGEVAFDLTFAGQVTPRVKEIVEDVIAAALADYIGLYGDKTKVADPTTGKPKVARHFDLEETARGFVCRVHGSTGHMGSIMENDGAITKMAMFVRALVRSKSNLAAAGGGDLTMSLHGEPTAASLKLEGGQGFVPTHSMEDVMARMRSAACQGADFYLRLTGQAAAATVTVSYDKLHNAAFDGDPDSPTMRNAIAAAKAVGMWKDQPMMGWTVSCDSRLFATEYPGMPVITSGAGLLQYAHSDAEQIKVDDLMASVAFVATYILKEAGVV